MTWDPIWEDIFRSSDWGSYPNEDFIRFIARNYYGAPDRKRIRVLEIGCGNGCNVWYLAREGFAAAGIDGSSTAIEKAQARLRREGVDAELNVGDVAALLSYYGRGSVDVIADIGCLQCNDLQAIREIIAQAHEVLVPGGMVFSIVVTTGSYGDGLGREIAPGTFADITDGPLKGRGVNHFFSLAEIEDLYAAFARTSVEYTARSYEQGSKEYKTWLVTAQKRA